MKVREIMTEPPLTGTPDMSLAVAARLMLETDYGTLPVVDGRTLVGIITDRDICLALVGTNRNALNIPVREVMTKKVRTASLDEDVHDALATMREARVRRLPVCGACGCLKGMLSMEDIVVRGLQGGAVSPDELIATLTAIYVRVPVIAEADPAGDGFMPG